MEERMMILKMLQEGKITADEANKLLEAIERGNQSSEFNRANRDKFEEKFSKFKEKAGKFSDQVGDSFSAGKEKFSTNTEKFADEFSKKMENFGSEMAEAAMKLSDKLVNFLGNTFDIGHDKYQFTKAYTYPSTEAANINIQSTNFSVKVSPSETEDIVVNMYVNSSVPQLNIDEFFKVENIENNYSFITEFGGRTWGKIELLIPKHVSSVVINTTNGKCELNEISAGYIKSHTSNGKVVVYKCHTNEFEAVTNNGKVVYEQSSSRTANIGTSNGKIEITESKIDNIDARTSNGSIQLSGINKLEASEGRYTLKTSNGRIHLGLSNCEDCGFMVDANTSLGSLNINLPDLNYAINKKTSSLNSSAMVKSNNYDSIENKIYIKANTSNSSISIEGQ